MFLVKAKRQIEMQDVKTLDLKRDREACVVNRMVSTQISSESTCSDGDSVDGAGSSRNKSPNISTSDMDFNPDELPDGYSFSPPKMIVTAGDEDNCPVRDAEVCGTVGHCLCVAVNPWLYSPGEIPGLLPMTSAGRLACTVPRVRHTRLRWDGGVRVSC